MRSLRVGLTHREPVSKPVGLVKFFFSLNSRMISCSQRQAGIFVIHFRRQNDGLFFAVFSINQSMVYFALQPKAGLMHVDQIN